MTMDRARVGRMGERLAAAHLEELGLRIVDRNWRCAGEAVRGELDIVARDGQTLVFCEVKTRRRAHAESAFAAVTPRKQGQLRRLAGAYLAAAGGGAEAVRFDLVAVWWPPEGGRARVAHVRGIA
ncbi:MAG: YraN family protein [Egibacteraceae bacterium]